MADPGKTYEYGRTPEETAPGLLGLFNFMSGPVVDALTPERREVITPSKTTYDVGEGYAYPTKTEAVYGAPEKALEYMPVVQGAKGIYDFAGKFLSDGKFREQTGEALSKGVGRLFSDYYRSGVNLARTGETSFYDSEEGREVSFDPLLPLEIGTTAGALLPVKGAGSVIGMFAGRKAATAQPAMFDLAEKMAKKGHSRDEIWDQTGLFRYKDKNGEPMGDWRFEISDETAEAFVNKKVLTPTSRLRQNASPVVKDLLKHPKLFEAYPGVVQSVKGVEYQTDYKKLQDADALLIRQFIDGIIDKDKLEALRAPLKESLKTLNNTTIPVSAPIRIGKFTNSYAAILGPGDGMDPALLDLPLADIPLRKVGRNVSGDYRPSEDSIGISDTPGKKNKFDAYVDNSKYGPTWDEDGKYFQRFSTTKKLEDEYAAQRLFEEAGINLKKPDSSKNETSYGLTKPSTTVNPKTGLRFLVKVNPEDLPPYLKERFDQLVAGGRMYKKEDYDPTNRFRSTTLHELQHAIQSRELFEKGGSTREFSSTKDLDGNKLTPYDQYLRLFGEAEARNVQTRRDFTDEQRRNRPPWTTLDKPESQLFTRGDAGLSEYTSRYTASTPAEDLIEPDL